MNANVDLIAKFVQDLRYQVQFRDQRMLNTLEREGAGFLPLARACMYFEPNRTYQNGVVESTERT